MKNYSSESYVVAPDSPVAPGSWTPLIPKLRPTWPTFSGLTYSSSSSSSSFLSPRSWSTPKGLGRRRSASVALVEAPSKANKGILGGPAQGSRPSEAQMIGWAI
uniref:Uncharacterized protein n=1 Tax=Romanomermis culicivorax TaxID=13658 RepID=A0A915KGL5_ROMCU